MTQATSYGLSGQLERVVTTTQNGSGTVTGRSRVDYRSNTQGIRTISVDWNDANLDGTFAAGERTGSIEYLIDNSNFTGYQQTILEVTKNAAGQATKRISYTFGTDEITQTVSTLNASTGAVTATQTQTFGHDGRGSVQVLFDAAAAIAQVYTYSAYGELLAIHNGAAAVVGTIGQANLESLAATNKLYNGEAFDTRTGLYNFRARNYSASLGRFERLDPFAGNPTDPFSFNKYGFVHGNPVMGTDPRGRSLVSTGVTIATMAIASNIGLTVYQGIRHNASASTIAYSVAQNLAVFALIGASIFLSGPVALGASILLFGVTAYSAYNLFNNWGKLDAVDRTIVVLQALTFLGFARGALMIRGGSSPGALSLDPTVAEAMRETGLSESAIQEYVNVLGEPHVFRGTTSEYPGNPSLQELGLSPASIDPAIATAFATEAATASGQSGVVYYGKMSAFSETIAVGNYLRTLEAEVAVPVQPSTFATVAPFKLPAASARQILRDMGRDVPEQIGGKTELNSVLRSLQQQRMTPSEIREFLQRAQSQQQP